MTRSRVMVTVAVLFGTVTIGAAGCSSQPGTAAIRSVSPTRQPSSSPTVISPPSSAKISAPLGTFPAAHLVRSRPVRLQIAAIGVDSSLMDLGLRTDGTMQVPPGGFPAGWYTGGPTPGELGPAVIAGHIDMGGPGVFYSLHKVKPGDQVTITRTDGSRPVFRITRVAQFAKNRFPTAQVFGNLDHAGLRLITCGGTFNSHTGHYEDNLVAFADLVALR